MNHRELIDQLNSAMNIYNHYKNKGWYTIARRYLKNTVAPLMIKLQTLTNTKN
jgi:hypothetical protein